MTKLEIIDETVAYYSEDIGRRALVGSVCVYLGPEGKRCAVGRCMNPNIPARDITGNASGMTYMSDAFKPLRLEDTLQEKYKGHSPWFWDCLQQLHDRGG